MEKELFTVKADLNGIRLDKAVACIKPELARTQAQKYIEEGLVSVNGFSADKNYKVKAGDQITVTIPDLRQPEAKPEDIPLSVVYEDDDLLIVNKPRGMVVHPAAGNYEGTLVNALLFHCRGSLSGINGVLRPGIVHRIDKDTSGLLIVAKNDAAHKNLAAQIKEHSFTRVYEAIVIGNLKQDDGTIDAPIGRHPLKRKQMAVTQNHSRNAVTHYRVIARYQGYTHVQLKLETGRTHQIRVHMAYIGHPVAGDPVYGPTKKDAWLNGQCLHARTIGFIHPTSGEYMEFTSPLPEYFETFLKKLKS